MQKKIITYKIASMGKSISTLCLIILVLNLMVPIQGTNSLVGDTSVSIQPQTQTVLLEEDFTVDVFIDPSQPVRGVTFDISFNPCLLEVTMIIEGDFFTGYDTYFNDGLIDNQNGKITDVYGVILGPGNVSSSGTFATVMFTAKDKATNTSLLLSNVEVVNETHYVDIVVSNGTVHIIGEPLSADANGPYQGMAGMLIQFNGSASGGVPPYIWHWDFGDDETSVEQNPAHTYSKDGFYNVTLTVIDSENESDDDVVMAVVNPDNIPPTIIIDKPQKMLYVNNKKIARFLFPLIIGKIDIQAESSDNVGIEKVEFYIDNVLTETVYEEPYLWSWDERTFFKHSIMTRAYDKSENTDDDEINIWIFNFDTI